MIPRIVLLTVLFVFSATAAAGEKVFTFDYPTELRSDKPITEGLDQVDIRCSNTPGRPYTRVFVSTVADLGEPRAVVQFAPGEWYCVARVSNAIGWSTLSNEVFFSLPAETPEPDSPPKAPTNLAVSDPAP